MAKKADASGSKGANEGGEENSCQGKQDGEEGGEEKAQEKAIGQENRLESGAGGADTLILGPVYPAFLRSHVKTS